MAGGEIGSHPGFEAQHGSPLAAVKRRQKFDIGVLPGEPLNYGSELGSGCSPHHHGARNVSDLHRLLLRRVLGGLLSDLIVGMKLMVEVYAKLVHHREENLTDREGEKGRGRVFFFLQFWANGEILIS